MLKTRYPRKFIGVPVKYGMDKFIQIPASMVSTSKKGSTADLNVTSSTAKIAAMAIRLTTVLSSWTMFFMSYRLALCPRV